MFDDMHKMMARMQSAMDDAFGTSVGARPFLLPTVQGGTRLAKAPTIALHVIEKPEGYEVQAELPGVRKEDIQVEIHDNLVSIAAKAASHAERKEGERVVYSERIDGQLSRRFTLPVEIDESQSRAKFDNGVLSLNLVRRDKTPAMRQLTIA